MLPEARKQSCIRLHVFFASVHVVSVRTQWKITTERQAGSAPIIFVLVMYCNGFWWACSFTSNPSVHGFVPQSSLPSICPPFPSIFPPLHVWLLILCLKLCSIYYSTKLVTCFAFGCTHKQNGITRVNDQTPQSQWEATHVCRTMRCHMFGTVIKRAVAAAG